MSAKYKYAIKVAFFVAYSCCTNVFSSECPFCKSEVAGYKNVSCSDCGSALYAAVDTLKGENNLFQGSMLIGERKDDPCCTVEKAPSLKSTVPLSTSSAFAIEGIATATPYSLSPKISKFAASMVHTLFQNLKSPSCKIFNEEQYGGTLLLEATDSGVLSVNIGISELQPDTSPLAESLSSLTECIGELSIDSNWESMLDAANEFASQENNNTLYWVESFQQWIFINITPNGDNLVMLVWNWYCQQDGVHHYALLKFENVESVRLRLKILLTGRTTHAGYH